MNFRDLQYIVAVAKHRHFGKAAEEVHISQPTLSMQVRKLEDYLGAQLFERSNKHVMVTPIGEAIVERAQHILREADALRDVARLAQDPCAGAFRLGAFPTLAPYLLPKLVPLIRKHIPQMTLLLAEEKTSSLLERLLAGTLDAALLALPVEGEGLEHIRLFDDQFLLAVPNKHRLATRKQVSVKDIQKESILLLEEGHCLRAQALEMCGRIGASENLSFRATSMETLRQMVASGAGVTLIPTLAAQKTTGVTYVPFARPAPSRSIGIVWRKSSGRKPCIHTIAKLVSTL